MSKNALYTITGVVEKIEGNYIQLGNTTLENNGTIYTHITTAYIRQSYKTAKCDIGVGDEIKIEFVFKVNLFSLHLTTLSLTAIESVKIINTNHLHFNLKSPRNRDNLKNETLKISELSIEQILTKDHPHLHPILKYVNNGYPFKKNLEKGLNVTHTINDMSKEYAYNLLKTTRAGASTSMVISLLLDGLNAVVFVPTNDITDTYEETFDKYVKMTRDATKTFRKIQSNSRGCAKVKSKLECNASLNEMPFVLRDLCTECGMESVMDTILMSEDPIQLHSKLADGDAYHCTQKAIIEEQKYMDEDMHYDLTVITYDKAIALLSSKGKIAKMFLEIINTADVLIFDEFGSYLAKQPNNSVMWEKKQLKDTAKSKKADPINAAPITTTIIEELKKIIEILKNNEYVNYQILEPIFTYFINQTQHIIDEKRTHRRIKNPLIFRDYPENIYFNATNGKSLEGTPSMYEVLSKHFWNDYKGFENIIGADNKEEIKYLISLMMVMLAEDIVFSYTESNSWIEDELFKINTVKLHPGDNMLIDNINALIETQTVFFIDATMPNFAFEKIRRKVKNVMFGDPLHTNDKLLVIQNRTLNKFDNTRWKKGGKDYEKGRGYKREVINELMEVINDNGADNIYLWIPNKKTALEIFYLLNEEKDDIACIMNDHTHKQNKIIVDWMRSSEARGVENERRVHIILGNPEVPKSAYDYLAFMYPDHFDAINPHALENIARSHHKTVNDIKEIIETFHIPVWAGDLEYRKEFADKIERELISIISEELRVKFVSGDGWQASSRCKDPTATKPSTIYALGMDEAAVYNMVQWGYNLQRLHNQTYITDQSTLITPPSITLGNSKTISEYLGGEDIESIIPMSKSLDNFGLMFFYLRTFLLRPVTSEELWLKMPSNLKIGHNTENHLNGMWVAFSRLYTGGVKITEPSPGYFEYDYGESVGLDVPDKEIMLKVLLSAYRFDGKEVKIEDIMNNRWDKEITTEMVKEIFKLIDEYKLIENSNWKILEYPSRGKNHLKIVKNM